MTYFYEYTKRVISCKDNYCEGDVYCIYFPDQKIMKIGLSKGWTKQRFWSARRKIKSKYKVLFCIPCWDVISLESFLLNLARSSEYATQLNDFGTEYFLLSTDDGWKFWRTLGFRLMAIKTAKIEGLELYDKLMVASLLDKIDKEKHKKLISDYWMKVKRYRS